MTDDTLSRGSNHDVAAGPPDPLDVRPKLRQDSAFFQSSDGAVLRGTQADFHLRGKSAYELLTRLGPQLNGDRTLGEICADLDEIPRAKIVSVIGRLIDRGIVIDAARPRAETAVPARFGAQLEFLDHLGGGAATRFDRFRSAQILLAGAGEALRAAAAGLVRNGAGRLDIAPETWSATDARRLERLLVEGQTPGDDRTTTVRIDPAFGPTGYDVVLYCTDRGGLRRAVTLNERCHADGPLLVPLVTVGDLGVLGPVVRPGVRGCWLCAHLRLMATVPPDVAADAWRELALGAPAETTGGRFTNVQRMLGGAAAFEVFRLLTRALPADTEGAVVTQDLRTLESIRERLLPHPSCPVCADSCPPALADEVAALPEEQRLERLVGERVGVFTRLIEDPAPTATAIVAARLRLPPTDRAVGGIRDLTAFDDEAPAAARIRVMQAAALEYVARLGRHPLMVTGSPDELVGQGAPPAPVESLTTWTAQGRLETNPRLVWVPARELVGAGRWLVPLAAAYPMSAANLDHLVERTIAGVAVGFTTDAMVTQGLASVLAYRAIRDLVRGTGSVLEVPEDCTAADDRLASMAAQLRRLNPHARLFELPGAAPGHAIIAVADTGSDGPRWAVGQALSGREALARGIRDLTGQLQAHESGRTLDLGTGLLADLVLPARLPRRREPSRLTRPPTSTRNALDSLSSAGVIPLLVDTTTADLATAGLVAGTLLLLEGQAEPQDRQPSGA